MISYEKKNATLKMMAAVMALLFAGSTLGQGYGIAIPRPSQNIAATLAEVAAEVVVMQGFEAQLAEFTSHLQKGWAFTVPAWDRVGGKVIMDLAGTMERVESLQPESQAAARYGAVGDSGLLQTQENNLLVSSNLLMMFQDAGQDLHTQMTAINASHVFVKDQLKQLQLMSGLLEAQRTFLDAKAIGQP